MSIGGSGQNPSPIQLPPVDFQMLGGMGIQEQAQQIKEAGSPLSIDEIVSHLELLDTASVSLNQKTVDELLAGEPTLPPPQDVDVNPQKLAAMMDGNPFLKANPYATFNIIYLTLAFVLSRIKLEESEISAEFILQMAATAEEISTLIQEIGQTEHDMYMMSGFMQLASGITSIVGGIGAGFAGSAKSHAITTVTGGIGSAFSALDSFSKAHFTLKKSFMEAEKEILQNMMKLLERGLNASLDAYKGNDEMITQLLQNLQKMVEEAIKAHTWK